MARLAQMDEYDSRFGRRLVDEDFLAAGFTPEEVQQYRGAISHPSLTPEDRAAMEARYGLLQVPDYTMRQTAANRVQDKMILDGMDPYVAGLYSRRIFGDTAPTDGSLGIGLADLTPLGIRFSIEEGSRTAAQGYQQGDPLQMGLGALEAGMGLLEATPLTAAIGRGISNAASRMDPNTLYSLLGPPRAPSSAGEATGSVGVGGRVAGESNVRKSVRGMIGDQMDLTMDLVGPDGQQRGRVDYSVYDGQPAIQMIEVAPEFRRQGVATELLRILQREYPEQEIDWGSLTSDGSQLYNSTRFLDVDQTGGAGQLLPDLEARVRAAEADYLSTFSNDFQGDASAIRESFYRLEDELEVARAAAALPPKRLIDLAANRDQTVGLLASSAEPRNAAERMAQDILDLRAAGRAEEVTNEMMAQADPQYMFDNTPLPMDEASRMARAAEMGFDLEPYLRHGSKRDFPGFQGGAEQSTDYGWYGQGVSLAPNDPGISDAYAMVEKEGVGQWGGRVYPVTSRGRMYQWPEESPPALNREQSIEITQSLRDLGYEGANIYAPNDFDTWGDAAGAWRERVIYDPSNIRSRFARFDPEFRHLRNLSAGVGGLGLLALPQEEQRNGR